jgi:hypothetical protein
MISDIISVKGDLEITLTDEHGSIKQYLAIPNLIVTVGKSHIAARMQGVSQGVMSHMALGSSATTPTVGDLILNAEIVGGRVALATYTNTNNTVQATATFSAGIGTGTLREAGLLNASTGGTMLAHTTFPAITKASNDTLSINWTITIA